MKPMVLLALACAACSPGQVDEGAADPSEPAALAGGAAVPSQFVAKMYTEALGRAPDPGGWQGYIGWFASNGCSQDNLAAIAQGFFASTEYLSHPYTPAEQVVTLYRAILSREPDPGGFAYYRDLIAGGWTPATLAWYLAESGEMAAMIPQICAGQPYRTDWGGSWPVDLGGGIWDSATLQGCIDQNWVCSVPRNTIVYLSAPVHLWGGHVLETQGVPDPTNYAMQARLVRAFAGGGEQALVILEGDGAVLRGMWLSGQRHIYAGYASGDADQANVRHLWGANSLVYYNRVEFPLRGTNFEVSTGSLTILWNLIVSYTSSHDPIAGQAVGPWSDGVSFHAPNGLIAGNGIVDPSDVGIVLFGTDSQVQASEAYGNTIVHAGHSAYGSLGFDTIYGCNGCSFAGAGIHDNTILAGPSQHSDIMLVVGTGPWYTPNSGGPTGAGWGRGAAMWNNRTIWGDEWQRVSVQQAIVVDGMVDAYVQGNGLYISPEPLGGCFVPGASGYRVDPSDGSGDLQPGMVWGPTHACVGHPPR